MELTIDGKKITPCSGQTLLQLTEELGLGAAALSQRPLAARIGGEVFTLNYVPVRNAEEPEVRHAMAASNGVIRLLRYSDPAGREVYNRSMQFLVFLAIRQLWQNANAKVSCTLGNSVYITVEQAENFSVARLKERMHQLIGENFTFLRKRMTREEAIAQFHRNGQEDKCQLLSWVKEPTVDAYFYGDFADCFYGEMVPSTGYLTVWDLLPADGGFVLVYPDIAKADVVTNFAAMPHFFEVFAEGEKWCQLMDCENASQLNGLTHSGGIRELIRVNEALHEKRFSQIADAICSRGAKIVMLAGPSSSGKTTSANRLATQLRVHGKKPVLFSLDNYYFDRDMIPVGPDGKRDFEHINTIDTALFRQNMAQLLEGKQVEIPDFNFKTGKREWNGTSFAMEARTVILVEGIHGLNPLLLPENVADSLIFRMYASPLLPLNLDDHNRIPTSYLRLLRRIVRDYETRETSVQDTIAMWESVQRGERQWIFPFQENADVIFNSSTLYELAVLKKHIYPLLQTVTPADDCYDEVQSIVKILSFVLEADVDDEIPPTSLVREFIGGNSFYR